MKILVCKWIDLSHLNNILTLGDCFGGMVDFGGRKVSLRCVLTEKRQLKWIGISRIFSPFGVKLCGGSRSVTFGDCKGGCARRT